MRKVVNLKLVMVVMAVTLSFAIGDSEKWFSYVGIVLIMYFFLFITNLFKKIYNHDNLLTKILFDFTKTPIYISGVIVIAIVFLRKSYPNADYDFAYFIAAIGVVVSVIGILKRSNSTAGS
ncbi:MAG TPA: hypothetical protein VFW11_10850 [Cyclobacteriaceae bacterium]|nr:hypothetical protein [Cyclobacteriaceae bacterium]